MAKKIVLFLFLLTSWVGAKAQGTTNTIAPPVAIPPSPDAASLGKYGEIPVSKYTGVPNIDIPLYTIQENDITVPISLSFHASGYKVGEAASWVGLGWSINSGGVVSRSMRGRPDESYGYFDNINTILDWTDIQRSYIYMSGFSGTNAGGDPLDFWESIASQAIPVKETMWDFHALNKDLEPDLFYYNYPGGSGKFMFNRDQEIIQLPYQDMKIEPRSMTLSALGSGSLTGFNLYSPSGLKYTFDREETTTLRLDGSDTDEYSSAWYLNSISSSRSQKNVSFVYGIEAHVPMDPITSYSQTEIVDDVLGWNSEHSTTTAVSNSERNGTISRRYLTEIRWDEGVVKFISSTGRLDMPSSARKLDEVIVENSRGETIKHYRFVYSYFTGIGPSDYLGKFLKLDNILEVDILGGERTAYSFDYHGGAIPHRNSTASDHFGFYNGAHGNSSLIPPYVRARGITKVNGADRAPSPGASMGGTLAAITYPTGGKTVFNYEPHDYYSGAVAYWSTDGRTANAEYCHPDGLLYRQSDGSGVEGIECERIKEEVVTIPLRSRNIQIAVTTRLQTSTEGNPSGENTVTAIANGDLTVKIFEMVGSAEVMVWSISKTVLISDETTDLNGVLSAGKTYLLRAESKALGASIRGQLSFEVFNDNADALNTKTSGIRINNIEHYDLNNNTPVRRITYEYRQQNHPDHSSGNLLARTPSYQYESQKYRDGTAFVTNYVHTGSAVGLLGSLNNSHIIYQEVVERELGNGYTRSVFSHESDELIPSLFARPARLEMASSFWKSGHLLEEEIYHEDGTMLSKLINDYSYIPKESSTAFITELALDYGPPRHYNQFRWAFSYQRSGWSRLDKTTTKLFNKETGDVQTSITEYTYGEQDNQLILPSTVTYALDGDLDYSEQITYLNNRGENHVIDPVKSRVTYNSEGEVLERLENHYGGQTSTGIFKLSSQERKSADGNIIAELELRYNADPSIGLTPSYTANHQGENTEYLFAPYTRTPVARVLQTEQGNSYYNSFEGDGSASVAEAKTGSKSHNGGSFQISTSAFSPSDESNLKMSYWYWQNGNWLFSGELAFQRTINSPGTLLDEVRVYQTGALMTTYTYKPLVGITSVTDPNNITNYYEYDPLNRLLGIRDQDGNIIKNYHYHYWNEQNEN